MPIASQQLLPRGCRAPLGLPIFVRRAGRWGAGSVNPQVDGGAAGAPGGVEPTLHRFKVAGQRRPRVRKPKSGPASAVDARNKIRTRGHTSAAVHRLPGVLHVVPEQVPGPTQREAHRGVAGLARRRLDGLGLVAGQDAAKSRRSGKAKVRAAARPGMGSDWQCLLDGQHRRDPGRSPEAVPRACHGRLGRGDARASWGSPPGPDSSGKGQALTQLVITLVAAVADGRVACPTKGLPVATDERD
jgi:hypothetical protein